MISLYPLFFIISMIYSRIAHIKYGDAITLALATITFGGGFVALPAAFVPMIQIPIMVTILRFAPRIKKFLGV